MLFRGGRIQGVMGSVRFRIRGVVSWVNVEVGRWGRGEGGKGGRVEVGGGVSVWGVCGRIMASVQKEDVWCLFSHVLLVFPPVVTSSSVLLVASSSGL